MVTLHIFVDHSMIEVLGQVRVTSYIRTVDMKDAVFVKIMNT